MSDRLSITADSYETRIVGCNIDLDSLDEINAAEPDTYPLGDGWLHAPNGAATMKYDGEYEIHAFRRSYRDDEDVVLDVCGPEIGGEIELDPLEATRLGIALLAAGEAEYDGES